MSDIFISYARSTEAQARRLAEALRGIGYGVWRDDELPAHRSYSEVIEERLKAARAVVVVWSAEAVRSEWVRSEANRAREDRKLVQLSVDGAPLPMPFDQIQCADLTGWEGDTGAPGWRKVVGSLADLLGGAGAAPATPATPAAATARKLSICVLPFANMSGDPEQEYFSDGVSEDIITDLSKVSSLFVVARNTAFTFKGKSVEVPLVARQLNVGYVLEGSVRKAGSRVRITAQLVDGSSGGHVWAERFDRNLDDIFALQDEISRAIVDALKLRLLPEEKKAIERRGTDNVDAYNIYLMARQEYLTGRASERPYAAMIRLCKRAVEIDPDYAEAWALMALGRAYQDYAVGGQQGEAALEDAHRALRLNGRLSEAHAAKSWTLRSHGRPDEAAAEAGLALGLDPDSFDGNEAMALTLFQQGRIEDATRHWERVLELFDHDISSPSMLVTCYRALGRNQDMQRAAEIGLSRVEKILGHDLNNSRALGHGALALAALGQGERAKDWMNRALLLDPDRSNARYNFACTLANFLGDKDAALEMLAGFIPQIGPGLLAHAKVDPDLDSIRDDPRFKAMMAQAEARLAAEASPTMAAG